MSGIEPFIILSVTSFDLTVVSRGVGLYKLMTDAVSFELLFKQGGRIGAFESGKPLCEFRTVVGLNTFHLKRGGLKEHVEEPGGSIGVVFVEGLDKTPTGTFVYGGVLIELFTYDPRVLKADGRDIFNIDLNALTGVGHSLIRLRDILGVGRLYRSHMKAFKEPVEARDRPVIASHAELHPKDHKAGVRVPAAHIGDELYLLGGMLRGMAVRPP